MAMGRRENGDKVVYGVIGRGWGELGGQHGRAERYNDSRRLMTSESSQGSLIIPHIRFIQLE